MTLPSIAVTLVLAFGVSYISTGVLHWWLRRREAKRQKMLDGWVARFAAVEPKRCPLPDVELVEGLEREALPFGPQSEAYRDGLAKMKAVVEQGMRPTTRKLKSVR